MRILAAALACVVGSLAGHAMAAGTAEGGSPAMDSDRSCLARGIYQEARGEPVAGMVAVGYVAKNRTGGVRTACDVLTERKAGGRCEFSWACARLPAIREQEAWQRSLAVAEAVLAGGVPDPSGGATYFNTCDEAIRDWGGRYAMTARIGGHCFFSPGPARSTRLASVRFDLVRADGDGGDFILKVSHGGKSRVN